MSIASRLKTRRGQKILAKGNPRYVAAAPKKRPDKPVAKTAPSRKVTKKEDKADT